MNAEIDTIEIEDVEQENSPYINYDITSYPSDLTLAGIQQMWNDGSIVIPSFQRNFVWTIQQASLLIDSFLSGLPVPPVFFYVETDNRSLVIDGQQRIMSIVYFLEGYFGREDTQKKRQVFRLSLDEKHPFNGKTFDELNDSEKRKLLNLSVLRAINIRQLQPANENTSAYHIFERLNTGGTPLQPQEIRNCVFRGNFVNILKELNMNTDWRKIIGKEFPDKHQRDVELLLRVFALTNPDITYEKPMKEFLNNVMRRHRNAETKKVKEFFSSFPNVMSFIKTTLGSKPFHIRGPLNTSALDSVLCTTFGNFDNAPEDFKTRYKNLKADPFFLQYTQIGTTDVKTLHDRFSLTKKYLFG